MKDQGLDLIKTRDEYVVLAQKIRELHIGIQKLKEENEIPQNMRIDESAYLCFEEEKEAPQEV